MNNNQNKSEALNPDVPTLEYEKYLHLYHIRIFCE